MILWPKESPASETLSPYLDSLKNKIAIQAADLNRHQLLASLSEEVKPGPSSSTKRLGKTRKPGGEYIEILLYYVYKLLRSRIHTQP